MATMFCGIDWGESRHDVAIIDQSGNVLGRAKITDDAAGFTELLTLLAEAGDCEDKQIPVAIEKDHGGICQPV